MEFGEHQKTFAIYTLGCKVNQYDSEAIARELRGLGLRQVAFHEPADAYVVDTCTVTAEADRKSRKAVHKAVRLGQNAVVAVTGCGPTWNAEHFSKVLGVRVVSDNGGKGALAATIAAALGLGCRPQGSHLAPASPDNGADRFAPFAESGAHAGREAAETEAPPNGRARAYLKVQDGCNHGCAYCIVPRVRGPETSRPIPEVLEEARRRVGEGSRELVVTGVRLGGYCDPGSAPRASLVRLLEELNSLEGLARIRLSSLDPPDLSPTLIAAFAGLDKLCEHVHLPLQSGDDDILSAMRRGYDSQGFLSLVSELRRSVPEIGLTTDVMVGFPGETDAQFQNTVRVCREAGFSRLHVFQYSPRPGTPAAAMINRVPEAAKKERSQTLRRAGDELALQFARQFTGRTVEVLVEQYDEARGETEGLTRQYVRARARSQRCAAGTMQRIGVSAALEGELRGEEVSSPG